MNDKVEYLVAHGKIHDTAFYASASLEDLEQAERNRKERDFRTLDWLDQTKGIDPDNPPTGFGLTLGKWFIRKYGIA